jgi:hypothetical protein
MMRRKHKSAVQRPPLLLQELIAKRAGRFFQRLSCFCSSLVFSFTCSSAVSFSGAAFFSTAWNPLSSLGSSFCAAAPFLVTLTFARVFPIMPRIKSRTNRALQKKFVKKRR